VFYFSLEALLRSRRAIEEAARARCAAAAREELRAKHAHGRLEAALLEIYAHRSNARDLAEIERAFRTQAARIESLRIVCDRLRRASIDAARACRALELLRERHFAAYQHRCRRREERELDESNARRGAALGGNFS